MSIKNDLATLKNNIQNVKTKMYDNLTLKGVSVTSTDTLDTMADKIEDITVGEGGGSGGSGNPFEVIGYDTMPTYISDGIAYGKTIYDNWDGSVSESYDAKFKRDTNIVFLPNIDLSNAERTMEMFLGCVNLRYIPHLELGNSLSLYAMFSGCTSLLDIDLSTWRPSKTIATGEMFAGCKALHTADLSGWSMPENKNAKGMFKGCTNLVNINLDNWYLPKANLNNMFSGCTSLTDIDLSTLRPSETESTNGMFSGCNALRTADLSGWSMPENTDLNYMFSGCTNLVTVKLDNWYLPKANLNNMFKECSSLVSVDFSTCQINNATDMSNTFNGCSSLASVNFTNMDTTKITAYTYTFNNCSKLEKIIGHLSVKGFTQNIANSTFVGITTNRSITYFTIKDIGFYSGMTSANFNRLSNWGTGDTTNKATLVNSLETYSYDRSTAGYSTCTITLSTNSKNALTSTDIAAITAKGYTIA